MHIMNFSHIHPHSSLSSSNKPSSSFFPPSFSSSTCLWTRESRVVCISMGEKLIYQCTGSLAVALSLKKMSPLTSLPLTANNTPQGAGRASWNSTTHKEMFTGPNLEGHTHADTCSCSESCMQWPGHVWKVSWPHISPSTWLVGSFCPLCLDVSLAQAVDFLRFCSLLIFAPNSPFG